MPRDLDPRPDIRERAAWARPGRGARGGRSVAIEDSGHVFGRDLALPQGRSRERVLLRAREYQLRGSEVRILATAGTFRVVRLDDLQRPEVRPPMLRKDIEHLRRLELVQTVPYVVGRERTTLVTLTQHGRAMLEDTRHDDQDGMRQVFYAGIAKPRELAHDTRVYQAYLQAAGRLAADGQRIRGVVLEETLRREYQVFLQEPNRGCRHSTGRPERDPLEVARWAQDHQLPMTDGRVQFPDLRIEYETRDGERRSEDVEVMTPHYRGVHAAGKVRAGFTRYYAIGARLGGAGGCRRGGDWRHTRLAEDVLR